jgi:tRNA(Arg) A34 adenosine deaminase TadA
LKEFLAIMLKQNGDWISHAENSLLRTVSWKIKRNPDGYSRLYTTWEPCLMCTGMAVLSRVNEIIYACSDPVGGVAKINPIDLDKWYKKHWPVFREGPFRDEFYNLLVKYMEENDIWKDFLEKFKRISL